MTGTLVPARGGPVSCTLMVGQGYALTRTNQLRMLLSL